MYQTILFQLLGAAAMAVTAAQLIKGQFQSRERRSYPVAASTVIYSGTLCFIDAATGYITTTATSNQFVGIACNTADNSSGSAGDIEVEVHFTGSYELTGSGLAQSDVGDLVYASDNYTLTTTAGTNSLVGRITKFVSATKVFVELNTNLDQ